MEALQEFVCNFWRLSGEQKVEDKVIAEELSLFVIICIEVVMNF